METSRVNRGMRVPRQYVMVRLLFSLAALGSVMVGLLAFTPGFDVSPAGLLILLAFIGVPPFFYVAAVKTGAGSYLSGTALLALVAWVQGYVSTHSYSSTVAVGYLWVFLGSWVIVLATLLVERLALTAGRGDGE
jgi:hypothetical protein